ncbi:MAG: class I SAM-dependent methyltransferase [Bacteroidota bacterium]
MPTIKLLFILLILSNYPVKAQHHPPGKANEYMHQSSVDELIKRFESPERDAYQHPKKVMDYLGNVEGMTIMDIGTGSGYFAVRLADKGAEVIAADVNEEFLAHVRKRVQNNDLHNIEVRKIPYDSPALKEAEADKVLIVNTYHHIEARSQYFAKVRNGTKPGGELVVIDFFKMDTPVGPPTHHKVSMDQVIAELKDAGYQFFDVEVNLLPYQFIITAK